LNLLTLTGNYNSTGRSYSGFAATFPPGRFAFYPSASCQILLPTSKVADTYECEYATNGAFFTWDITKTGSLCVGNLVSDGKIWQLPTDGSGTLRANFGIKTDGTITTGYHSQSTLNTTKFS